MSSCTMELFIIPFSALRENSTACMHCCFNSCYPDSTNFSSAITPLSTIREPPRYLNLADVCGDLKGDRFDKFKALLQSINDRSNDKTTYMDNGITINQDFVNLMFNRSKSKRIEKDSSLILRFAGVQSSDENRASEYIKAQSKKG